MASRSGHDNYVASSIQTTARGRNGDDAMRSDDAKREGRAQGCPGGGYPGLCGSYLAETSQRDPRGNSRFMKFPFHIATVISQLVYQRLHNG